MKQLLLFIALLLNFFYTLRAQSLKEIAERPWWGKGQFETEMVMPGILIITYELKELRLDKDNIISGKLIEKMVLDDISYYKTSLISGKATPENMTLELKEHKVLTADAIPDPLEWPATSFQLKAGYDPDRPSGFALKGQALWGTLKGDVDFRDYPFTR